MADSERVDAASDRRTVNNVMRHEYRVLTDAEKAQMMAVKDRGLAFVDLLHEIGGTGGDFHGAGDGTGESARQSSRELAIAQTKIEEAVMWAVKHLTR